MSQKERDKKCFVIEGKYITDCKSVKLSRINLQAFKNSKLFSNYHPCGQPFSFSCDPRTLSRVAIPLSPAQQIQGPISTLICLHVLTPPCPSPLKELGRGHHPWRAHGACLTLAEPHPALEMESSSYASCRRRWKGWRDGARTWRERQRRTNCLKRVSLG